MIKEHRPTIVRKIWGGKKLEAMKGLPLEAGAVPVGETLEINDPKLPYLAKFIDTSDELSIQVHPHDEYARIHENSSGKTECWLILSAAPGAGIYLGLKPNVTKEVLKKSLLEKKPINELLNFYPVTKGDFFFVPAGSIHAIGRDITLAEVQQNSGITYRVWDWERMDEKGNPRELHVEKSLDVINFDPSNNLIKFFKTVSENVFNLPSSSILCSHPDFELVIFNYKNQGEVYTKELFKKRPCSILNLEGKIKVNGEVYDSFAAITLENEKNYSLELLEAGSTLVIY